MTSAPVDLERGGETEDKKKQTKKSLGKILKKQKDWLDYGTGEVGTTIQRTRFQNEEKARTMDTAA